MKKKILTMLSAATLAVLNCFAATQYTKGDFTYSYVVGSGEAKVDKYSGSDSSVTIPSSFTIKVGTYSDGLDKFETFYITGISPGAFKNNKTITSVSWPPRLKTIDGSWAVEGYYRGGAFEGCTNLSDIPSLSGITTIGLSAFAGCAGLKSVEIPSSVTSLSMSAFLNCTGLKTAVVNYSGILPSGLFGGCTSLESLVLGDGVVGIEGEFRGYITYAPYPLSNCNGLKNVSLGRGITVIPGSFIAGLSQLERVTASGSIKIIGDGAFSGCTSIIEIPSLSAVTNIGQNAFYNCGSLAGSIGIPKCKKIGKNAFRYCYGISKVELGDPLTEIGEYAFNSCTSLHTVTFNGAPPTAYDNSFMDVKSGALGLYTTLYAHEWRERINADGTWHRLIMEPMYPIQPPTLTATQYHNQHPQGVRLTWSPVDGAPGYVIFRKIVGENGFQSVFATTATEYIDKVATIPNVKDFKAQYTVAVAVWNGNDRESIRYLSVQSEPASGCWRKDLPPQIATIVKENDAPLLTGVRGKNLVTFEFTTSHDTYRYEFKEARVTGISGAKRIEFVSSTPTVDLEIPVGCHGYWSFSGKGVFWDKLSNSEHVTGLFTIQRSRVCFRRNECDGQRIEGAPIRGNVKKVPNWYKYWWRDRALTSLRDPDVYFEVSDATDIGGKTDMYDGEIIIRKEAVAGNYHTTLNANGETVSLHSLNPSPLLSCAEVVKHELGHRDMWEKRGRFSGQLAWGMFHRNDDDKDGLLNDVEKLCVFLPFNYKNNNTFNLSSGFGSLTKGYDEEVYVRYLGTYEHNESYFDRVMKPENDFSWDSGDTTQTTLSLVRTISKPLLGKTTSNLADYLVPICQSGVLYKINAYGTIDYGTDNDIVGKIQSVRLTNTTDNGENALAISIVCNAKIASPCIFFASIIDDENSPVAWANWLGNLTEGENQIELKVDGNILRESKKSGFKVSTISIFNEICEQAEPLAVFKVDSEAPVNLDYLDFSSENMIITEACFQVTNDELCVTAVIDSPIQIDNASVSAIISDVNSNEYVANTIIENQSLSKGANYVAMSFHSEEIRKNCLNDNLYLSRLAVEKDGILLAAFDGELRISLKDSLLLNPTNAVLSVNTMTVTDELVVAGGDEKYSGINFTLDVENLHTNVVDYSLSAILTSTNSLTIDVATFDVSLTSGVNRITIPFLGTKIRASEINGPYALTCVRLESKNDAIASQTLRMNSMTPECAAADFQGNVIESIDGVVRLQNRNNSIVVNVSFATSGAVSGLVKAALIDANDNVVTFGHGDFAAKSSGITKAAVAFAISNITESAYSMPLRVAYISIEPDDKLVTGLYDDEIEFEISDVYYKYYVDAANGDDENMGDSLASARKTLQSAVSDAEDGDTVFVKQGVYAPVISQNKAITIVSMDGNAIIDGGGTTRCAYLGSGSSETNTVLVGFTLRNGLYSMGAGAYGGTLKKCVIENCRATQRGGGVCYSVLEDCQLRDNTATQYGGGAFMSTLRRCLVVGNMSTGSYGGGIMDSDAYDCIIQRNEAATFGGGAGFSRIYNSTIVGNHSVRNGGGVYNSTVANSIIWGNTTESANPIYNNHSATYGAYNCTTPLLPGDGNIDSDPLLRGAEFGGFMLSAESPCLEAGLDNDEEAEYYSNGLTNYVVGVMGAADFFGNERVQGAHVDMGAVEGVTNACLVMTRTIGHGSLDVSYELLQSHSTIKITADESIRPVDHFELSDGRILTGSELLLSDITTDIFVTAYFKFYEFYVDAEKGDDANDGFSWESAKKTIQSAIDSARDGEKIHVAKGTYTPIISPDKGVEILAVDGADSTFIDGGGTNRCAYLATTGTMASQTNTVLVGFTLINGRAASGGGAYGGTLKNCIIKSNTAEGSTYCYGGGTYYGVQYDCRYENNSVFATMYGYGGAAYYGTSYNCVYTGNSVYGPTNAYGGAIYYGTHYDCGITNNTSSTYGGGVSGGTYYRTSVVRNEAKWGGGCYSATFHDGEVLRNTASQGGGTDYGNIYRSVISYNKAAGDGGGAYKSYLTDCIVSYNQSAASGGGALLTEYTATRTVFKNNIARGSGGGVYGGTCNYCGITNNTATSNGGGAYNITATSTSFFGNSAATGGGVYNGTYNSCTIEGNMSSGEGGGAYGGTFYDSLILNNEATGVGGGLSRGTFHRTRITGNRSNGDGGGVYNGTGYNSLVAKNKGLGNGGGTYSGNNYNCTITGNWCGGNGGGTCNGYQYNSIIVDNADPDGEYNRYSGSIYNCFAANDGDPMFVNSHEDDYRLRTGSPCINAGNNSYANGTSDLALATRIQDGTVDMGCYEGGVDGFVVSVDSVGAGNLEYDPSVVTNGGSFVISASDKGRAFLHFKTNGVVATTMPTLTLDGITGDVKVTAEFVHEMFVDGTTGADDNDGLSWATAKKTIQSAIDASEEGDAIWVADGVYTPVSTNDRRVDIVGVNGAEKTIIEGGGAECCAILGMDYRFSNNSRLSGFTLRNGCSSYGGGVKYGRVDNCIVENCRATTNGGGVDYSNISNCIVRNNSAQSSGGGFTGGSWRRAVYCKFVGNTARENGGGVTGGAVCRNCEFVNNIAGSNGGGMNSGIAHDSTFVGNRAATGGATYNGTFYRCIFEGNTASGDGGGAYAGTFYDSVVSNNTASGAGGGLCRSSYWRTWVSNNVSNGDGGGVYNGNGYSSLVIYNKTIGGSGGGTYSGYTYNCTIYGNYTGYYGGGTCNGYHYNSIIWGNENGGGANNTSGGSYYSCMMVDPLFVDVHADDFRLRVGSSCINAGSSSYVQGSLDLANQMRVQGGTIDIGAYEGGVSGFVVSVDSLGHGAIEHGPCVVATGGTFSIAARPTERAFMHFLTNGVVATTSPTLTLNGISGDIDVTAVFMHELFVDGTNGSDINSGLSWSEAKKTIQEAVNVSIDGDTIWVASGVYSPIVTDNRRIAIVSSDGAESAIIDGGNAARCAKLGATTTDDGTLIRGFTLRNGYADFGGGVKSGRAENCIIENCRSTSNGGGADDTSLSNCVVRYNTSNYGGGSSMYCRYCKMVDCTFMGNSAQYYGGGAYGGTANNCLFIGNVANNRGGGMSDCFAYNCTVSGNRSPSGGGVYEVIAYGSIVSGNTSTGEGGGAYGGTFYDSVISNNTAFGVGGGLSRSTFHRSHVVDNMASGDGGGVYNGTGYNSIIAKNKTNGNGGGTYSGNNYNCTITGNYSALSGGGTYSGYRYNSIIWNNHNAYGEYNCEGGGSQYNCHTADPKFVNADESDYRLRVGSPCINAGNASYVNGSQDVARRTRVLDGAVDIGAHEGAVDGFVVNVKLFGDATVSHSPAIVGSNGEFTVFSVSSTRPFTGVMTNGVFASSTVPFILTGIMSDVELTIDCVHDLYVDANNGDDANNGFSRNAAKQSIQAAINVALSGDVIHVANGYYKPFSSNNKAILIKSDNGLGGCIVDGEYLERCATLGGSPSEVQTTIDGLTLCNGYSSAGGGCYYGTVVNCAVEDCYSTGDGGGAYGSLLKDCTLSGNVANSNGGGAYGSLVRTWRCTFNGNVSYGSGGAVYSGAHYDSTFEGNRAYSNGGAAYGAVLQRCILHNNQASTGGGTYNGTMYSCLYYDNYASSSVGGAYYGTLYNCTLTRNRAAGTTGGMYYSTAYNTISRNNTLNSGAINDSYGSSYYNCCLSSSSGSNTLVADPLFFDVANDDFRLSMSSPCLNRGDNSRVAESTDLLGGPRTQDGTVDIGCYEGPVNIWRITVVACGRGTVLSSGTSIMDGGSLSFTAVEDGYSFLGFYTNGVFATSEMKFTWSNISSHGELEAWFRQDIYVDASKPDDSGDGLSWDAARKDLTAVVAEVSNGANIWVKNGTYTPIITSNKKITITAVDGNSATAIDGGGTDCCVYAYTNNVSVGLMTNSVVVGFTLRNGYALQGGGAYGGTLRECVIESNNAVRYGGGTYYGVQYGCAYRNNSVEGTSVARGGAAYYGTSYNCTYESNSVTSESTSDGGAIFGGTHYDCIIKNNVSGTRGGGIANATCYRCVLSGNTAQMGGASYSGSLRDCLVTGNSASDLGGGSYSTTLIGCTVAGNTAGDAGGIMLGIARNSIIWGNCVTNGISTNCVSTTLLYSCTDIIDGETGCVATDPMFVDAENGDFRLLRSSPCIDAGNNSYLSSVSTCDVARNSRIVNGVVDMGCYEGAYSTVAETQTTPIPVPHVWLDGYPSLLAQCGGDYEAMANAQSPGKDENGKVWANGSPCYIWQDYVAGTDPTKDSVFTAKIEIVEGTPIITWEPDTPELRATRVYRILGNKTLMNGNWTDVTDKDKSEYNFFMVTVDLPQ